MIINVLDLETTGWLNSGGKIVEVGVAGLNTDTGTVSEVFHSLCREEGMSIKDRGAWIFENSDLTVEEVRAAPTFEEISWELQALLHNSDANTAYNKAFDFDFLRSRGMDIGTEWPCPMIRATPIVKAPKKNGKKGYKWPTVEEAWHFFFPNEPYIEQHRGLDDAMHEAKIVFELYKAGHMHN